MQNKYKINYKKDIRIAKKKRFIAFVTISASIIVLLICLVIFLYVKKRSPNDGKSFARFDGNDNILDKSEIININGREDDEKAADEIIKNNDSDKVNNQEIPDIGDIKPESEENEDSKTELIADEKKFVYGEKVPENEAVENDYFDDAVFIGNSQMEGVSIYSSMKNATVFAGKGIMADTIFTKEVVKIQGGTRITIMDALSKEKFGKIYIMLGANELGWAFDYLFIEQYSKVIDEIKSLQPNAKIYVNGIIPVSKEKSSTDKIYNNENIDNYNELILNMTKEKEVYYVDSKEALADEEGNLPADAGTDGVHFNSVYYEKWFNYLKTHTVD